MKNIITKMKLKKQLILTIANILFILTKPQLIQLIKISDELQF